MFAAVLPRSRRSSKKWGTLLLEPTCLIPILVMFVVGGCLYYKSMDTFAEPVVRHALKDEHVMSLDANEARMRRMHEAPVSHEAIIATKVKKPAHVNDAYPCDDWDDCTQCVEHGCGWCSGQGWCVLDQPGICASAEDHIGSVGKSKTCPANAGVL